MRKPGPEQLVPGPRQLEAFYLRCIGLCWAEIGDQMGVTKATAYCYATDAAERLIRLPPTPDIKERRDLALYHFPEAASRVLNMELCHD